METWIKLRNKIIRWKYRWILKPILFRFDPEDVHDWFISIGKFLGSLLTTRGLTKICFYYENRALEQEILGIKFKNPLGLAAGFDKNGEMIEIMPSVGFGFAEIGSVTGRACAGNERPRLWRLPKLQSLIVYYGLKNNGAKEVASRLARAREVRLNSTKYDFSRPTHHSFPVGVSLAKTNDQQTITTEAGVADYLHAYQKFVEAEIGDYYTINISCPNTFGGEPFVKAEKLDKLLATLSQGKTWPKPIFLKMPSGINDQEIDEIIELARKYKISGFISTNLSKESATKGGLSGKAVSELSTKQIRYIYQKAGEEFIIIGCGGIFSPEDAYAKIKAGASLLQLITGMIFEGPQLISEINQGLVALLHQDGYSNIREAIGKEVILKSP